MRCNSKAVCIQEESSLLSAALPGGECGAAAAFSLPQFPPAAGSCGAVPNAAGCAPGAGGLAGAAGGERTITATNGGCVFYFSSFYFIFLFPTPSQKAISFQEARSPN